MNWTVRKYLGQIIFRTNRLEGFKIRFRRRKILDKPVCRECAVLFATKCAKLRLFNTCCKRFRAGLVGRNLLKRVARPERFELPAF